MKKRLKTLKAKIPVNKAGGGLVYNKMERYYSFSGTENGIYPRRNRGEDIEGTSMREVEEETGVNQLRIIRKLQKTYHVFKRNGVYKLKITHWFEMQSDFEEPQGQLEEGIEK
jgi:ADP-ribose pyrophosphatase YjhB (NUDIX family)